MAYREIAEALGMNHYTAVASSIRRLKILCQENQHIRRLENTIQQKNNAKPDLTPLVVLNQT